MGLAYSETSQFREALQTLEAALKIYRQVGDRQGEANSIMNLGIAYNSLGQYAKAIEYLQQQFVIIKDIGDRRRADWQPRVIRGTSRIP